MSSFAALQIKFTQNIFLKYQIGNINYILARWEPIFGDTLSTFILLLFTGFHEGIANAISLSVSSLTHLKRIGLVNNSTDIYESNINFLMLMALKKVAYAPFAYLIDQVYD